jgi:hypothetical protein
MKGILPLGPDVIFNDPYNWETQDYKVVCQTSSFGVGGGTVYAVINKTTGVVEAEGSQLPITLITCVAIQKALDDIRSGAAFELPVAESSSRPH